MDRLKNKISVITGGNSGIGFGIASAFQEQGATGVIAGRNQENLDRSSAQLGRAFMGVKADVTRKEDLQRLFTYTAERFGKIDILVVNAGGAIEGMRMGSIDETTEIDYDHYMDLNLKSVYFTVKEALPYMNEGGSVILIGSIAGHRAFPGQAVYAAAKAAVVSLARGLSLDLLKRKIRVNVLSPGTIDTPAFDKLVPVEAVQEIKDSWTKLIPIGRIGQPEDIGNAAVYLASDESSFMAGAELIVDGGVLSISSMQ